MTDASEQSSLPGPEAAVEATAPGMAAVPGMAEAPGMAEPDVAATLSLAATVEALLFVAPSSVTISQLAEAVGQSEAQVKKALETLEQQFEAGRGLRLQRHAGRLQLTTAPQLAATVEKFLGLEATARLSRAGLEVLAIVAYRQPITRPGVDAIRGVNSDGALKSLLTKGLIQEVGRAEGPGRPILYGTTAEFLQHFGLKSLVELPPYDQVDDNEKKENLLLKD